MYRQLLIGVLLAAPFGLALAQDEAPDAGDPDATLPDGVDSEAIANSGAFKEDDPWEPFNRGVFKFNEVVDRNLAKPLARGYQNVVPTPVNDGVSNFFSNLGELSNITNSAFQAKGEAALISTGRFVFNSTFGVLGLFDVAGYMELPEQDEDFGQTLGYWGVDTGPYLVLPFLGPSTVRDSAGMGVDYFGPDGWDLLARPGRYYAIGLYAVDLRASLLPYEDRITGDRYEFMRNTYLQRRSYLVNDGRIEEDPFAEDDEDLMLDDF